MARVAVFSERDGRSDAKGKRIQRIRRKNDDDKQLSRVEA
jgi:hypothetical protein